MNSYILSSLKDTLKHWYIPLIVGIVFILTSIAVFSTPLNALLTMAIFMSISFIIGGIFEIIFAITNHKAMDNWGWTLAFGIFTLIAGIVLVTNPGLSILTLSLYVGFAILFRSIASISFAIDIKRYANSHWKGLLALGIVGVILSIILLLRPIYAGLSAVYLMGFGFLFSGIFSVYWAFQLRKIYRMSKK